MVISRSTVATLLKTSILQLCKASIPLRKGAEIDGIVCVMVGSEEEQIVVRVHEKFPPQEDYGGHTKKRRRNNHRQASQATGLHDSETSDAESLPMKAARVDVISTDDDPHDAPNKVKVEQVSSDADNEAMSQDAQLTSTEGLEIEAVKYVGKHIGSADLSTALSRELECNYCHYLLPTFEDLQKHNEGLHQATTCCYCWQSFTDQSVFTSHMETHYEQRRAAVKAREKVKADGKRKKCGICSQEYRHYSLMVEHMRMHQDGAPSIQCYTCFTCNSYYPDITSFTEHRTQLHANVHQCRCDNCELYFTFEEFRHHERECVEPISNFVYPKEEKEESSHIVDEPMGDINVTRESPEGDTSLDQSMASSSEKNNSPGTMLRKVLQSDTSLNQLYTKYIPTSSPVVAGENSNSRWNDGPSLWDVTEGDGMSEGDEETIIFPGKDISHQSFATASDIPNKSKDVNYIYMCNICGTSTTFYQEYEKHCWTDHSRLVCSYCAMTFATQRNLQRHMRRHTGEKPFECNKCHKRFYRRDDMNYHHKRCLEPDFESNKIALSL